MENGYIVLTPEKIEDIFKGLHLEIGMFLHGLPHTQSAVQQVLESKKQELLKSIKQ
jgi:hypothetical protein